MRTSHSERVGGTTFRSPASDPASERVGARNTPAPSSPTRAPSLCTPRRSLEALRRTARRSKTGVAVDRCCVGYCRRVIAGVAAAAEVPGRRAGRERAAFRRRRLSSGLHRGGAVRDGLPAADGARHVPQCVPKAGKRPLIQSDLRHAVLGTRVPSFGCVMGTSLLRTMPEAERRSRRNDAHSSL